MDYKKKPDGTCLAVTQSPWKELNSVNRCGIPDIALRKKNNSLAKYIWSHFERKWLSCSTSEKIFSTAALRNDNVYRVNNGHRSTQKALTDLKLPNLK